MKILVLAQSLPISSKMPGSPRLYELISRVAKKHKVILAYLAEGSVRSDQLDYNLNDIFDETIEIGVEKDFSNLGKQIHRLTLSASLLTKYRYPKFYQEVRSQVAEIINKSKPDIIYVDLLYMTQFLSNDTTCPVLVDFCDCISSLVRQQAHQERSIGRKVLLLLESLSIKRMEKTALEFAKVSVVISEADCKELPYDSASDKAAVIPNGVDLDYFSAVSSDREAYKLVFTGAMDYQPNEDAALFFINQILPKLLVEQPKFQFWVVGRNPSATLRACNNGKSIFVTGTVPDIRLFVCSAAIFVSPLRFGAGMKNKVLAAMVMGTPVVASNESVSGMDLENGKHFMLANTSDEFVTAILELSANEEKRQILASNALKHANVSYSWDKSAAKLCSLMEHAVPQ
jgi:glycosyltransferase involved in cell wall biosynthesis